MPYKPLRLDLFQVNQSLEQVQANWTLIDDELDKQKLGRKDTPFTQVVRTRMLVAYDRVDCLLKSRTHPYSDDGILEMFALNNYVHYGDDVRLMQEYHEAVDATYEQFRLRIIPIQNWYRRHKNDHPLKIAAETYVSILGFPQLFNEGNHRTGTLIADWISMYYGFPPFVLSIENAIAFFSPSSEIKSFIDRSTWRGRTKLPKYRRVFRNFWEDHIDVKYIRL